LTNLQQLNLAGNKLAGQYFGTFIKSFLEQAFCSHQMQKKQAMSSRFLRCFVFVLYGATGVEETEAQLSAHLPNCKLYL
jgi:hypothetical protein